MVRKVIAKSICIAMMTTLWGCDDDGGPVAVSFSKALGGKETEIIPGIGDLPAPAITRDLVNCTDSARVGDVSDWITEASGATTYNPEKYFGLRTTRTVDIVIEACDSVQANTLAKRGIFWLASDLIAEKSDNPIRVADCPAEVTDAEIIASHDTKILLADMGSDRLRPDGLEAQRAVYVYDGSSMRESHDLNLEYKFFVKFKPGVTDQNGVIITDLDRFDWTGGDVNPKDRAFYIINKSVRAFGSAQTRLDPVLVFKIPYEVWSNPALADTEVEPEFVARVPLELMVAMDIRREPEDVIDAFINKLPAGPMQVRAVRILKTADLTKLNPQTDEELLESNDSGEPLARVWASVWGDSPEQASQNIAMRLLVTDMKFDPINGTSFYLLTYNGIMKVDIDLTETFPPNGEILALKVYRYLDEAPPLLQNEALALVVQIPEGSDPATASQTVSFHYTTETKVDVSIDNVPYFFEAPDAPVMSLRCEIPELSLTGDSAP